MRFNSALGIIAVLALLLQGCGHKGPLTLPAPDATNSQQGK
jgi:predicted small lipoprotein YifL